MNVQLLLVMLIISKSVDWIFQSYDEASKKENNLYFLFTHSAGYAFLTLIIVGVILNINFEMWVVVVLFTSHMIIDKRVIINYIIKLKGVPSDKINMVDMKILQTNIDQRFHELLILIVVLII